MEIPQSNRRTGRDGQSARVTCEFRKSHCSHGDPPHPAGAGLSDSQIARHVGVDHKTVAAWREKLEGTWEIPKSNQRPPHPA